jgi:predicted ATPase
MALARRVNEPALALQAHQALGITALCRGDQTAAQWNIEQVAAIYDPARHGVHSVLFGQDPGVICKAYGAVVLWLLGYPDTAVEQCETAIRMSDGLSPTSQAIALYFASSVYQLCRDGPRTSQRAQQAIDISAEHGLPFWLAGSTVLSGWALAETGSLSDGLARLQEGLRQWRSTGSVTYETYYLGLLGEVSLRCGDLEMAQRTVDEALALAARTGEKLYEAELYRLRGEIMLAKSGDASIDARDSAEQVFQSSLEVANQQDVKSLALRSAMSLARLWLRFGKPSKAREILAAVYESFSEGFGAADLREAASLLESGRLVAK